MAKNKTQKQRAKEKELSKLHNSLSWFCVQHNFECKTQTLKKGWYQKTGTYETKEGNWMHHVRLRGTTENITISDIDFNKIINNFKQMNEHLLCAGRIISTNFKLKTK